MNHSIYEHLNSTDTVPPSIKNCPQDISKISDTDPVQATWDEPDISDNSGVFISIASISSGSLFRYGTHNVQYTANDEAGNEASCQFKVIIQIRRRAGSRRGDDLQFYEGDCNEMPVHSQILFRMGQMLAKDPFVLSQCALKPETCEKYWVSDSTVHCGPGDNQKDTEPPVVISCPQNIELETQRGNPYWNNLPEVSWKEPVFEDNSREPLKITKEGSSVNSGDKLAYGQYSVVYTATDSSGNTAKCSFQITVKPMACTMELPEYGAIVCGYPTVEGMDLLTIDCIVLCRSKHQFNRNPYPIYACSEEGLWWTLTSTFDPIGPHLPSLNYTCRVGTNVNAILLCNTKGAAVKPVQYSTSILHDKECFIVMN
ncbi:Sushi, von Willebrand factor type A, EGF and pentraxin domain-containing protein 1 [Acipenser ruthenus]|uniref:Sushi, von Willebrand factor type A, EGF and pentraxin domain-containing protein 1 n=1 Tax=Acipenser ruthenus TaxID=7906 RepID=A0A444UQ54_ACIRT|nr:Sushi, von Willebrand factor type A, EGF and pentraxin domain-containing protein 1 [Acipenser ruthenus]